MYGRPPRLTSTYVVPNRKNTALAGVAAAGDFRTIDVVDGHAAAIA